MPLVRIELSAPLTQDKKSEVIKNISAITAEATGKPEAYIMVTLTEAAICMAGTEALAAYLDISSIGSINSSINSKLSGGIPAYLLKALGIPADRIFLTFTDVPAANWGWNGSTFG